MDFKHALTNCITSSSHPTVTDLYQGKVREVYTLNSQILGIVVTDRISAFDFIMHQAIPFKGQILNKLAEFGFNKVSHIIPNHIIEVPHPNITIAKKCVPIPIEVVIRAHLTGHAWRTYKSGERLLCGVTLPEGLSEHDPLPEPILTPATKSLEGHDEDISEEEILAEGIVSTVLWSEIREKAFELFKIGQEVAREQGLILVDTKYEFGLNVDELTLIDEVHTTDSSRYFYFDGYEQRQKDRQPQKQLSKEFLREWLMKNDFQGLNGQTLPDLPDSFRIEVYKRYEQLYEQLTGSSFTPTIIEDINSDLKAVFSPYIN
ncbi:MAG: phosphoribosylaminoimidazolesuccinocarboxamide synthase [Bacteroidota bacterium]|nr:phosphoribosylaminoimidazolesuccinocarboxamide synthase [Bacteroidota bacterium]